MTIALPKKCITFVALLSLLKLLHRCRPTYERLKQTRPYCIDSSCNGVAQILVFWIIQFVAIPFQQFQRQVRVYCRKEISINCLRDRASNIVTACKKKDLLSFTTLFPELRARHSDLPPTFASTFSHKTVKVKFSHQLLEYTNYNSRGACVHIHVTGFWRNSIQQF